MSTRHLVDPDVAPLLDILPSFDFTAEILPTIRSGSLGRFPEPPPPPFDPERVLAPGRDGAPDVPLLVFTPPGKRTSRAAILHIHGGGMIIGTADMARNSLPPVCLAHGVLAVSVDYRLAPDTPFPGPQEDCYAALDWMAAHAGALGIDPDRIIVMGESAGGGLAAALAQMVRDRGAHRLAGQVLTYPMLDHRTGGPDCRWNNPMTGEFVWTRKSNQFGWSSLQGDYDAVDARRGWFSPSLADDLSNLPPAFISVGAMDLFLDEDLDYARRLIAAGVPVELHTYPGAFHAFNAMQDAPVAQAANRDLMAAMGRMVA